MIRRSLGALLILAAAAWLAACSDNPTGPGVAVTGAWGGEHIELTADADGARVQFDCAHSVIDGNPVVEKDRTLDWTGTCWFEGGPVDPNAPPAPVPVRYEGQVLGDLMILHVTRTDTDEALGSYRLTRGQDGVLWRCL